MPPKDKTGKTLDEQLKDLQQEKENLQEQVATKKLQQQDQTKENQIKHEEFVKLKVKANSLKKELKMIEIQKNEAGAVKDDEDGDEKEEEPIDESEVSIELQESEQDDYGDEKSKSEDTQSDNNEQDDDEQLLSGMKPADLLKEKQWEKLISEKMKHLIDDNIAILSQAYNQNKEKKGTDDKGGGTAAVNDGTQIRTYINSVTIKVDLADVLRIDGAAGKTKSVIKEQVFKVTQDTSFIDMRNEACQFWDLEDIKDKFTLVLPNMHDIMSLNKEPTHIAHTLADYFEIHRSKKAILHLIKPNQFRRKIYSEEKNFIKIKTATVSTHCKVKEQKSQEEVKREQDQEDLQKFFKKYPELKEVRIENMKQFDLNAKNRTKLRNPDMSCCNMILSLAMFILSVYTFYSHRDLNNEYFNRQLIYQKLIEPPEDSGFVKFQEIGTIQGLQNFISTTIAQQIFEPQAARDNTDDSYISPYLFQQSLIPLGKLRFRQQRRKDKTCKEDNRIVSELRADAASRIRCLEESLSTSEQSNFDIEGPGDFQWYKWQSARSLDTRGSFYTDDIKITGDGYVQDFSLGLTSEEFNQQVTQVFYGQEQFFNYNTAAIVISFNSYEPSEDRFITTQLRLEFTLAGLLVPAPAKIICYSLDQREQTSEWAILVDAIQFFFCLCYIYRILMKCRMNSEEEIEGYSPGCSITTDFLVVICFMLKFIFSQQTNYHDIEAILQDNHQDNDAEEYIELVHFADYYLEQYQMYTLIIIFNIFNLLGALRIFRIVHWIMLIIERTFSVIGLFMMLLIPMQLGFSFLSYVFVGPYLEKYSSIVDGLKQQIITMMGQQDSLSLMRSNLMFTIAWTMIFIVFFAYFFVTASIVGFEDGFDETVHQKGYPSDFAKASVWDFKDYLVWSVSWLPDDKLAIFKKQIAYDNDEEEKEDLQNGNQNQMF